MQGAGNQFFTGAGFAVDQNSDIGLRQAANGSEDFLHGWGFTDDFGAHFRLFGGIVLHLFFGVGQRSFDNRNGLIDIKGFRQILKGAALVGRYRAVEIRVSGHDDDGQVG